MSTSKRTTGRSRLRAGYQAVVRSRKFNEFKQSKTNLLGLSIVLVLAFCAVFAMPITIRFSVEGFSFSQTIQPFQLAPYDPIQQDLPNRLQSPNSDHLMGTDQLGRDTFSRVLYGARISLGVSVMVVVITLLVGIVMGVISGYLGGWTDETIMRLVDLLMAFPGLLFALVVVAVLGPGLVNLLLALALTGWTGYARIIRGEVLSVKQDEFIKAAQVMGASRRRIMSRHVIPNVVSPIVVLATLNLGTVVLATAGLSFLGFGAQPPTPEWGNMIARSRNTLTTAWWVANFPGMAIMLTVLGFNLLGDGLRDILDPRDLGNQEGAGL
jgi:peptide/nickel transport system permease protein